MKPRFLPWLIVLIVLACGTAGLGFLLLAQNVTTGGRIVLALGQLLTYAWVIRGLFLWRHVGWVAKISRILIMTMIAGFLAGMSRTLGYDSAAIVFAGAWGMAIAFMLGLELLRLAFSPGWPVLGVARTLLDEAIRMKMALIFVVMLVLLVPVLPFMLGGETRLQYRLESFLTYSLTLISTLLAAMTILLAARTISSELTDRQAFLTLTKPISRAGYLAGKWIGIMGLNLLLLLVSGVGVVAFVKVIERTPAMDAADYIAVQEQVLTARVAIEPVPVDTAVMQLDFEKRLEDLRLRGADPLVYGNVGDPIAQVNPEQRKAIQLDAMRTWLTISPRNSTTYRFTGLKVAKEQGPTLQLRFKPKASSAGGDGMIRLAFRINDRPYANPVPDPELFGRPIPPVRNNTFHTATILTEDIRDDGTLDLTITNTGTNADQASISFKPGEGLEMFYKVGGFETNLIKGLVVMWVRLGFLAAVGLAAATFLGFPTACLACFLVYFAAVGSDYLGESFATYASVPRDQVPWWDKIWLTVGKLIQQTKDGEYYDAFKLVVRLVGEGFTFLVPPISRYSPTPLIAYGRSVENSMILGSLVRIGVVSTGAVAVFAMFVFGRREVAKVTV